MDRELSNSENKEIIKQENMNYDKESDFNRI